MSEETYNGWTNYATWRVNLELISGDWVYDSFDEKPEQDQLASYLEDTTQEFVRESVGDYNEEHVATQYAMAFMDDVDWYEIAEAILADWPEE